MIFRKSNHYPSLIGNFILLLNSQIWDCLFLIIPLRRYYNCQCRIYCSLVPTGLGSGISRFKLRMHSLQVDNQMPLSPMHVLFRPQRVGEQLDSILKLSLTMQSNGSLDHWIYSYIGFHVLVVVHSKPSSSSVVGLVGPGAAEIIPYVEIDRKNIAARLIDKAKELCSSKLVGDVIAEVVEGDVRNVLCEAVERHHATILDHPRHPSSAIVDSVGNALHSNFTENPDQEYAKQEKLILEKLGQLDDL